MRQTTVQTKRMKLAQGKHNARASGAGLGDDFECTSDAEGAQSGLPSMVPLGSLCETITKGASPTWQGFDYCDKGIPFVRSQNVGWGSLQLSHVAHLPEAFNLKEKKSVLRTDDVLLNLVGASIGRACIATSEVHGGNVNQAVAVIRVRKETLLPPYLKWFLISPIAQARIHSEKVDVARANFSLEDTRCLPVPLVPLSEQRRMAKWIITHHVSPEAVERDRDLCEALKRQGLLNPSRSRFPKDPNTQKGNWAEILLAEYLVASCDAELPVYRLRYNPNVDQSMKGDDVLAFDLDSSPTRLLVGEAKFRKTPTKAVVEEIVASLVKSHSGNIPASLQFVADCLFESGNNELGARVAGCNALFAQRQLQLDYVGLLVSNQDAHLHMQKNAKAEVRRLAVISLGLADPEGVVAASYAGASI